jgi:hypothetical protein
MEKMCGSLELGVRGVKTFLWVVRSLEWDVQVWPWGGTYWRGSCWVWLVFVGTLVDYICYCRYMVGGIAYIANHAVLQRLISRLVEFRPACHAYEVILVGWGAGCGGLARHVFRVIERWKMLGVWWDLDVRYVTEIRLLRETNSLIHARNRSGLLKGLKVGRCTTVKHGSRNVHSCQREKKWTSIHTSRLRHPACAQ